jgi:hypothetical protein
VELYMCIYRFSTLGQRSAASSPGEGKRVIAGRETTRKGEDGRRKIKKKNKKKQTDRPLVMQSMVFFNINQRRGKGPFPTKPVRSRSPKNRPQSPTDMPLSCSSLRDAEERKIIDKA